jgi:hypothetical protein
MKGKAMQVRKEAQQHAGAHLALLPLQRGGQCHRGPVSAPQQDSPLQRPQGHPSGHVSQEGLQQLLEGFCGVLDRIVVRQTMLLQDLHS